MHCSAMRGPDPSSEQSSPRPGRRVFITVAEVSGDLHAAQLIHSLLELDPTLQVEGIGGLAMRAAGAVIHHETVGNAAMGAGGLGRVSEVLSLLRWTRRYFDQHRIDLQICCDSPAMNFHFAKLAHRRGVPVLFYIAPQLWAWREGRMRKLRKWVDHVACILPFEEDYFRGHRVNASFVGHPLFDELPDRPARTPHEESGPLPAPVVGLLPGSRRGEAEQNYPPMLQIAERIRAAFPSVQLLTPTTAATHPVVQRLVAETQHAAKITFEQDAFDTMVPRCDLCITVSGTATLHVASHRVPMLVVYRVKPVLWHGLGRWLMRTRTFALVNLLAGRHVVREFIPWFGNPVPVAQAAIDLLRHPAELNEQSRRLAELVHTLDRPGASGNVAKLALEMMRRSESKSFTV